MATSRKAEGRTRGSARFTFSKLLRINDGDHHHMITFSGRFVIQTSSSCCIDASVSKSLKSAPVKPLECSATHFTSVSVNEFATLRNCTYVGSPLFHYLQNLLLFRHRRNFDFDLAIETSGPA